jgi:hypothetical protein
LRHRSATETPASCSFKIPDDLLFRKATALHALVLVMGQSELQPGLSPRGNVTRGRRNYADAFIAGVKSEEELCSLLLYNTTGIIQNPDVDADLPAEIKLVSAVTL